MSLFSPRGSDVISKNNIFYAVEYPNGGTQFTTGGYASTLSYYPELDNYNQIDGNLYSTYVGKSGTDVIMKINWEEVTMADLVAGGGEASGDYTNRYLVDPLFVDFDNNDFHIQLNSPAIDEGANLQSFIEGLGLEWKDRDGKLRDNTPDCGAYQYEDRGPDITPPEVTGATLLDSITLKIMFSEVLDQTTSEDKDIYFNGNEIPSGVYLYKLETPKYINVKKMILMQ